MKYLNALLTGIVILIGSFLYSIALHVFTIPAKLIPGGVSGIASLVQILTQFPAGYTLLFINIPLLILAFFFLSRPFVYKTLCCVVVCTLFLNFFKWKGFYTFSEKEPFVTAIAGGVLSGFGIGLLINFGISTGGSEIMGMLIHKKISSLSISWIIFSINLCIILIGGLLYRTLLKIPTTQVIQIIIYSFFQVFMSSRSMEMVLNGMSSAVKFEVITTQAEIISREITKEMKRGVTLMDSEGGYSHIKNKTLVCIISRMQVSQFKKLLKRYDPNAFAYAVDTREVLGTGFQKDDFLPIPNRWKRRLKKEATFPKKDRRPKKDEG